MRFRWPEWERSEAGRSAPLPRRRRLLGFLERTFEIHQGLAQNGLQIDQLAMQFVSGFHQFACPLEGEGKPNDSAGNLFLGDRTGGRGGFSHFYLRLARGLLSRDPWIPAEPGAIVVPLPAWIRPGPVPTILKELPSKGKPAGHGLT